MRANCHGVINSQLNYLELTPCDDSVLGGAMSLNFGDFGGRERRPQLFGQDLRNATSDANSE